MANNAHIPAGEMDYAVPPGETILENIEYLGMNQREFAGRMGMAPKTINEIINGKAPVIPATAAKLESVLGVKAEFWLNMEANYRAALARIAQQKQIQREMEIASNFNPFYTEMSNVGFVPHAKEPSERVAFLRSFFRVASLELLPKLALGDACFRKKETPSNSPYALMAWVRQAERIAETIGVEPFNKERLIHILPQLRSLSGCPGGFDKEIVSLCASCGVAVAFVPHIKGTSVNGAMQWLTPTKALVALSLRYAFADIFWFSFFHELAHILKTHSKKAFYISLDSDDSHEEPLQTEQEADADAFARDTLIPGAHYQCFLAQGNFARQSVNAFSETIGIHPSIVWGRLAKENRVAWKHIYRYRKRLSFAEK